jgi:FkbM family methyltransferase
MNGLVKKYLPYGVVILLVYLLVPIIFISKSMQGFSTVAYYFIFPATAIVCAAMYCSKYGMDFLFTLIAPVVFIPSMLIYNGGFQLTNIILLVAYLISSAFYAIVVITHKFLVKQNLAECRHTRNYHFMLFGNFKNILHYTNGKYKHITALEPNAKNYSKLQLHCADMKNLELWQLGAYSHNTTLCFNNKAGRNSAIVSESSTKTPVAAVDTILCGRAATYVKADVEGADFETILGMKNTLKMFKPKLNFSAYHRFEDIFRLPLLISGINPEYKIYLRHHPYIPAWDTNLYCI